MDTTDSEQPFFQISGDNAGSMRITEAGLQISSKSCGSIEEFEKTWNKSFSLNYKTEISFEAIKKISLEEGETEVRLQYRAKLGFPAERKMSFTSDENRDAFFRLLQQKGFVKTVNTMTPLKALSYYGLALFVTLSIGGLLYFTALELNPANIRDSKAAPDRHAMADYLPG